MASRLPYLKYRLKRLFSQNRREKPLYFFTHHKVGSKFLARIIREICWENNWSHTSLYGVAPEIPENVDVILFNHSVGSLKQLKPGFLGFHIIRDPRDILISGYLYHRRCTEDWCTNTDFGTASPIGYPQVPHSQRHRSEQWKRDYLLSLDNRSYQQNLLGRSERDGILFELDHYAGWTIDHIAEWNYGNPSVMELKFEDIMAEFDDSFRRIFEHAELESSQMRHAMQVAGKEDLSKKSDAALKGDSHVFSRETSKWNKFFDSEIKERFKQRYGNLLIKLGYEDSPNW